MTDAEDPLRAVRLAKLDALKALGIDPYPYEFARTHEAADLERRHTALAAGAETGESVRVAGRIRAIRNSGMFIDLHDASGKIQIFCHRDYLDSQGLAAVRLLDIGDLIGVEGVVRRTPRGELTVNASAVSVLAKTLRPLPEKYHGLADVELRYRQRYLDLIMNPESRETLRRRSRIVAALRTNLVVRGYLEVETPMLHTIPGGASAKPFVTHHNALDIDLYLRIAPELHLKRLVVGGLADKVFEINRCFRNEGLSPRHNPEFTSLELYEAYVDYRAMMQLTEELITAAAEAVLGSLRIDYGGTGIDLSPPWPRRGMAELVEAATGIDFLALDGAEDARRAAAGLGVVLTGSENWGQALEAVFGARVEADLIAADPCHGLSTRHLAAGKSRPDRSPACRAVRDLHLRLGSRQRVFRTYRPAGPARSVRSPDAGARRRRRRGAAARRGLRDGARIRAAALRRARHWHRPPGDAADRQPVDPRRDRISNPAAAVTARLRGSGSSKW